MATSTRFTVLALLLATIGVGADQEPPSVAAFNQRVQAYFTLHQRLEGDLPTVKISGDPAVIRRAIDDLGARIRAERHDAKQGDFFTADIVPLFRRWIHAACRGDYAKLLEMTSEEMPKMPKAVVNGRWPGDGAGFMPPTVLRQFPDLPDGLEYRFVNRDLVLWDTHADVVLDIITDAIPRLTEPSA